MCVIGEFDWRLELKKSSMERRLLADYPYDLLKEEAVISHDNLLKHEYESVSMRRLSEAHANSSSRMAIARRCRLTRGGWCGLYERQTPFSFKAAPRGSKQCPNNCTNVGNCNHDTGLCDCPAGWTGKDCSDILLRPCTNRYRHTGSAPAVRQSTKKRLTGPDFLTLPSQSPRSIMLI
jgi:hypothetical protein